jgi:hypothetical protein
VKDDLEITTSILDQLEIYAAAPMKSFRLDIGEELTIWGWLLLSATVLIEFGFIGIAVRLGQRNGQIIVSLVVGIAICVFMVGGWLLKCIDVHVFKAKDQCTNETSNDT